MINKILRRTKTIDSWNSYTERGKCNREWKEIRKAKVNYLRDGLRNDIEAYIREYGKNNIEDTGEEEENY